MLKVSRQYLNASFCSELNSQRQLTPYSFKLSLPAAGGKSPLDVYLSVTASFYSVTT